MFQISKKCKQVVRLETPHETSSAWSGCRAVRVVSWPLGPGTAACVWRMWRPGGYQECHEPHPELATMKFSIKTLASEDGHMDKEPLSKIVKNRKR